MIKYRSKFEATIAAQVPEAAYESRTISFVQPAKARRYTPDFILPNGIIIEGKGKLDQDDRDKMVLIKAQHPELDIRFCFQRAKNPIRKGSKTSYAKWAEDHGFPWCEKTIPTSWLTEGAK